MSAQENLQSFQEISGCTDANEAQHFLDACNGDLERAINLFFTQSARRKTISKPSSSAASLRPRANPNPTNDASMIELSDDDDEGSAPNNNDEVRAPIAPIRGPIVEQSFHQTYGLHSVSRSYSKSEDNAALFLASRRGPSNPVFEQYRDFRELADQQDYNLRRRIAHTLRANNAGNNDDVDLANPPARNGNSMELDAPSSSNGSSHSQRNGESSRHSTRMKDLRTLFRPPLDLICQKEWDQVVLYARQQKRWLLINVQMAAEFVCQVLNRDIWSEPTVREIIKENFVFWQTYHDSPCGIRVCGYYELSEFPAIFIIDPRTGEEVMKLRAPDSVSFLDQVTSFLDRYPTFAARDAEICGRSLPKNDSIDNDKFNEGQNAQNSFSDTNDKTGSRRRKRKSDSSDMSVCSVTDSDANLQAKRMKRVVSINDDLNSVDQPTTSGFNGSCLFMPSPDEWKNHLGAVLAHSKPIRLMLKLPTGERETVELFNTTPLRALFLYIAGRNLSPNEYHLVLSFPKRVFNMEYQEQTIEAAGIGPQEVIHVEKV